MIEVGAPSKTASLPGERRQVTVLFADMEGFTAIAERLGEEATYALIQPIYEMMAAAVQEHGGLVKDFTGDGIMALFGVPIALEDGPLRACRAALAIHERLADRTVEIGNTYNVYPRMRIGINTGVAVVTKVRLETTALGDVVNMAARLQTLAEPGTVALSETTHRLVQGMVAATFRGEHTVKGKAELQKVYRLVSVHAGATRFKAAISSGLSAYVGREDQLGMLMTALGEAQNGLRVFDIMGEPGMGKSRLLHEFIRRLDRDRVALLSGSCLADGQQTPFLPFIDVVRGSFSISIGEDVSEVAHKLAIGLAELQLHSARNIGLLANLLGLAPPDDALAGLDGVLIGLRTRELLQAMLVARCRLSPVVLLFEDLHWIDSVSEDLIAKIVDEAAGLPLLVLATRRMEYAPPWRNRPKVTALHLQPLSPDDVLRLVEARLKVKALPEALAVKLIDRAGGNALFAEEIVSFLSEQDVLHMVDGALEYDGAAVAAALPSSLQDLLTARVDRLAPGDRMLLQAAAVIGRRFDPELLSAVAADANNLEPRLAGMQALDLVYSDSTSEDWIFKHALVRDALYQSLLAGPRVALHAKVAEEVERRSDNRRSEVVEMLAHHYGQADHSEKAFVYLAMAGTKALDTYSFDEAGGYFRAAVALLDKFPDCASDGQVAGLLVAYASYLHLTLKLKLLIETIEHYAERLDHLGDSTDRAIVLHHYILGLIWTGRYEDATKEQNRLSAMAERLGDASEAYALASAIHHATFLAPMSIAEFEKHSVKAVAAASRTNDLKLRCFTRFVIGWEEFHLGQLSKAKASADELIALGQRVNDPRSIGWGFYMKAWAALVCDDYEAALDYARTAMELARAPFEMEGGRLAMTLALVLLRRDEGLPMLEALLIRYRADGWHWYLVPTEGLYGVGLAIAGRLREGIQQLKKTIAWLDAEGYQRTADWHRLSLCEVYLEMVAGKKPPFKTLFKNIITIVAVVPTVESRIVTLAGETIQHGLYLEGHHAGRTEMILGMMYKAKNKKALALKHLVEARRLIEPLGLTPILQRIDKGLTELG